jgi:hypothetical protein
MALPLNPREVAAHLTAEAERFESYARAADLPNGDKYAAADSRIIASLLREAATKATITLALARMMRAGRAVLAQTEAA